MLDDFLVATSEQQPSQSADPSTDSLERLKAAYEAGKTAFERGNYQQSVTQLVTASALANPGSRVGGEIQIWLVTAHEAAGEQSQALELCRKLCHHPDYETRQQSKRLLYILEAPRLKMRPEWLTEIPDLSKIPDSDGRSGGAASRYAAANSTRATEPKPIELPEPPDPKLVNTRDNQFVWVALLLLALVLGALGWASQL